MAFTVPNLVDATYEAQARVFSTDLAILGAAAGGQIGVVGGGCAVTAQAPTAMAVDVSAGVAVIAGTSYTVAGNAVGIAANATAYPRLDLVSVGVSGTATVTAGTAASDPLPPALPANVAALAFVYVPAAAGSITAVQITDKRIFVPTPAEASGWNTVSKATTESRTSTTTLADDAELTFALAASTKYRIRGYLWFHVASGAVAPGLKFGLGGPASPTLVRALAHTLYPYTTQVAYIFTAFSTSTSFAGANEGYYPYLIDGVVHNGVNAGTFSIQWAQYASSTTALEVLAGSYIEYEEA